jgi:hypothetical protein
MLLQAGTAQNHCEKKPSEWRWFWREGEEWTCVCGLALREVIKGLAFLSIWLVQGRGTSVLGCLGEGKKRTQWLDVAPEDLISAWSDWGKCPVVGGEGSMHSTQVLGGYQKTDFCPT